MKKVLLYSLEYGGECRLYQSEKLLPWKIKKILVNVLTNANLQNWSSQSSVHILLKLI